MNIKNLKKTGVLIAALLIPVLFYFVFQTQHDKRQPSLEFPVPSKKETKVVNGDTIVDSVHHTIPDFSFVNQHGDTIINEEFEGKVYVANFIFTNCPNECPVMTNQLARVQSAFEDNDQVKFISHTVDPENDSVEVLADFAESYGAIPDKWHFVTGDKQEIYDLAIKGYFIPAGEDPNPEVQFLHSDKMVLVDQKGRIRGFYTGVDKKEIDRLITELRVLLHENE